MGVLSWFHTIEICVFLTRSRQMSLRLICFIQFTRLLWTGWAGFASCHVLLNQAQLALGS